jgi:hypothetical protein
MVPVRARGAAAATAAAAAAGAESRPGQNCKETGQTERIWLGARRGRGGGLLAPRFASRTDARDQRRSAKVIKRQPTICNHSAQSANRMEWMIVQMEELSDKEKKYAEHRAGLALNFLHSYIYIYLNSKCNSLHMNMHSFLVRKNTAGSESTTTPINLRLNLRAFPSRCSYISAFLAC